MKSPISPRRDGTSFVHIHSPFSLSLSFILVHASPPDLRSLRATRYSPRGFPPSSRNYSKQTRVTRKLHLQSCHWSINWNPNRIEFPSKKGEIHFAENLSRLEREREGVLDNRVMG